MELPIKNDEQNAVLFVLFGLQLVRRFTLKL